MSGPEQNRLEVNCRRLMRCFPQRYREVHEDEMVQVLMDTTQPGRSRPGAAEVAAIGQLGLRVWLRRSVSPRPESTFDALSVLAIGLPVLLMFPAGSAIALGMRYPSYLTATAGIPGWVLWVMTMAIAVGGNPRWAGRVAVAGVIASLAGEVAQLADHNFHTAVSDLSWIGAQIVAAVVLTDPARVRRGRQLLRPRRAALVTAVALVGGGAYGVAGRELMVFGDYNVRVALFIGGVAGSVAIGAMSLCNALGRALIPMIGALVAFWWAAKDQATELANFTPDIPSWFTVSPTLLVLVVAAPTATFVALRLLTGLLNMLIDRRGMPVAG